MSHIRRIVWTVSWDSLFVNYQNTEAGLTMKSVKGISSSEWQVDS